MIETIWDTKKAKLENQMKSRGIRGANELRSASLLVLRGRKSGRSYRISFTYGKNGKRKKGRYYAASAPGEAPAVRTGVFRVSFKPYSFNRGNVIVSRIESFKTVGKKLWVLGKLLEEGTERMAPRPYQEKIKQKALPKIKRIYREPYF